MGLTLKMIPWWILSLSLFTTVPLTSSQPNAPPPISPDAELCNGIFVSYTYSTGTKIKPNAAKNQPYRFESTITVLNNAQDELKSWRVFVGFTHREILVSATNAVLSDGSSLPVSVENGTTFAGYPASDLKSAIMTAGDITQMQALVELVGTQFGVAPPNVPLPNNITLLNDGWICPEASQRGTNVVQVCCMPDPKNNTTSPIADKFVPRQQGDLTIMYDVTKAYTTHYWAQVTIENHNQLGRLDYWNLNFLWMKDEFIYSTKGAYPSVVDSSECINGPQSKQYTFDFANVMTCARSPTIIDLPLTMYNDTELGLKPYCCRNGTILPPAMDPTKSKSVFQMQVYKMPPNSNSSAITPPQNWKVRGNLNPDYKCGPPVRVSPTQFPDWTGLPSANRSAFASWQVVCNITQPATPKCCVSFSSYFTDSVIPCKTCACGEGDRVARTCSTTSPPLLLPPQALLLPFENRTKLALSWAALKHQRVPDPLPCGDNCGVSINWHLATDYRGGWTARITLFNWGGTNFADWFAAVEMKSADSGFEKAYSFNGTTIAINGKNNTVLMEGLPGLNYLVAESEGTSKDFPVPGKQQSVILFTKKTTPGIKVGSGDGFPSKVFFNGQECSLPSSLPTSDGHRRHVSTFLLMLVPVLAFSILGIY